MRGRKSALAVELSEQEEHQLKAWVRSTTLPVGLVKRAHAVLLVAQKVPLKHVGQKVGLTERHVRTWVTRFITERIPGLSDRGGRGRKPVFSPRGGASGGQDRL